MGRTRYRAEARERIAAGAAARWVDAALAPAPSGSSEDAARACRATSRAGRALAASPTNTLDSLILSDDGTVLARREYVEFERRERPPACPERSLRTRDSDFNFDPWFVGASYDPMRHSGMASTLEQIKDAQPWRKEALAPLKPMHDQ